ncbi:MULTISPECIES: hypothetical protein [unclassified Paraburkholderia]|uniref:hypothetical protein n=1 Tax=unclassified Paraburkholderia TaxID=2615204 RepID=UPI002AB1F574|nr:MULTISPECIES: hypothetical protein [unclassified Paraburkholderia]
MNTYQLADRDQTTGWDAANNDVNGVNTFRMRPIEVAAQAGDVAEFESIMNDPAFNPQGARPFFFAEVLRGSGGYDADKRYAGLRPQLAIYRERFVAKH